MLPSTIKVNQFIESATAICVSCFISPGSGSNVWLGSFLCFLSLSSTVSPYNSHQRRLCPRPTREPWLTQVSDEEGSVVVAATADEEIEGEGAAEVATAEVIRTSGFL